MDNATKSSVLPGMVVLFRNGALTHWRGSDGKRTLCGALLYPTAFDGRQGHMCADCQMYKQRSANAQKGSADDRRDD